MNDVLKHLLGAAKEIVPLMVPGAGAVLAAGEKIRDALEAGKDMFEPGDQSAVEGTLRELNTAMNAAVDAEIAARRGDCSGSPFTHNKVGADARKGVV